MNSFGFGGTNAHAILDDSQGYFRSHGKTYQAHISSRSLSPFPNRALLEDVHPKRRLLVLSAQSEKSAKLIALRLKIYISERSRLDQERLLESLCYTYFNRRSLFAYRLAIQASTTFELLDTLDIMKLKPSQAITQPRVGFCFTGQGAQWYAMGRSLLRSYQRYKDTLIRAQACLRDLGATWFLIGAALVLLDIPDSNERQMSFSRMKPTR